MTQVFDYLKTMENKIHYYTNNENLASNPQQYTTKILNQEFTFKTDIGVFCKSYLDFGSNLLIEEFICPNVEGKYLDVGCGYGPIGISLSKVYNKEFLMLDINKRAVSLTKENIILNNALAQALESNVLDAVGDEQFACIISNPPIRAGKKVVYAIYEEAFNHLKENGELWIVIQKKQGAPSTMEKLESIFGNVSVIAKKKGYYIIKSVKKNLD